MNWVKGMNLDKYVNWWCPECYPKREKKVLILLKFFSDPSILVKLKWVRLLLKIYWLVWLKICQIVLSCNFSLSNWSLWCIIILHWTSYQLIHSVDIKLHRYSTLSLVISSSIHTVKDSHSTLKTWFSHWPSE